MDKMYHIALPNQAYWRVVYSLLEEIVGADRLTGPMSPFPEAGGFLMLELSSKGVRAGWNSLCYLPHCPLLQFVELESVVREHLKSLDDTMEVCGQTIRFHTDGGLQVNNCFAVSFDRVEEIHQRAKARREEKRWNRAKS